MQGIHPRQRSKKLDVNGTKVSAGGMLGPSEYQTVLQNRQTQGSPFTGSILLIPDGVNHTAGCIQTLTEQEQGMPIHIHDT
jgi:hypothetical protein